MTQISPYLLVFSNIHNISFIFLLLNFYSKVSRASSMKSLCWTHLKDIPLAEKTLFPKGIPHLAFVIPFLGLCSLFFWEILTAGQDLSDHVYYKYKQTVFIHYRSSSEIIQKQNRFWKNKSLWLPASQRERFLNYI